MVPNPSSVDRYMHLLYVAFFYIIMVMIMDQDIELIMSTKTDHIW